MPHLAPLADAQAPGEAQYQSALALYGEGRNGEAVQILTAKLLAFARP